MHVRIEPRRWRETLRREWANSLAAWGNLVANVSPEHPFWGRVIRAFAWLWQTVRRLRKLLMFVIVTAATAIIFGLVAYLTSPLNPSQQPNPQAWPGFMLFWHIGQWVSAHLGLSLIVALVAGVMVFLSRRADQALQVFNADGALRVGYVFEQVHRLRPDQFLARYVPGVYLARHDANGTDADQAARAALRDAMQEPRGRIGICVFGRPTEGKTRLAWEAVQEVLPNAVLVRWPHGGGSTFDFARVHGRHVILWLDDIHEYANRDETEARSLIDLPRQFIAAESQVTVVATCRDGPDEIRARAQFGQLLEQMVEIRPTDISQAEANQLASDLQAAGAEVLRDEFDGTPGSILLGVRRMREQRYPNLTDTAKRILHAMKLLRSAQIYVYPGSRVRGVTEDLFGLAGDEATWRSGRGELVDAGYLRLSAVNDVGERLLEPTADVYLERAVPDYPGQGAAEADDWLRLQTSLVQRADADALVGLGNAYFGKQAGDWKANVLRAEICYRIALPIYMQRDQSFKVLGTGNNIASTLLGQAELSSPDERMPLLDRAIDILRTLIQAYDPQAHSTPWAAAQHNLALILVQRARSAPAQQQVALLLAARQAVHAEMRTYTEQSAPTDWAFAQIALAEVLLHQALAVTGLRRKQVLLGGAEAAYRAALRILAQGADALRRAGAEFGLANVWHMQAEITEGSERIRLLREVIDLYHSALELATEAQFAEFARRVRENLARAEALLEQARANNGAESVHSP